MTLRFKSGLNNKTDTLQRDVASPSVGSIARPPSRSTAAADTAEGLAYEYVNDGVVSYEYQNDEQLNEERYHTPGLYPIELLTAAGSQQGYYEDTQGRQASRVCTCFKF